eukprot:COSAG02_NODE_36386_length_455_cov_0.851124_1_plen_151_part_11
MMYIDGLEISAPKFIPGVLWERWHNVETTISSLEQFREQDPRYPDHATQRGTMTATMETPQNLENYYYTRLRAIFWAKETGEYAFTVAANDFAEVLIGEMGSRSDPQEIERAAWYTEGPHGGWRNWDRFAGCDRVHCQHGPRIHLQADHFY